MIGLSLWAGMAGYHFYEGLPWLDAFLNASMIPSGMGPLAQPQTVNGKLFTGMYALYSGFVVIVARASSSRRSSIGRCTDSTSRGRISPITPLSQRLPNPMRSESNGRCGSGHLTKVSICIGSVGDSNTTPAWSLATSLLDRITFLYSPGTRVAGAQTPTRRTDGPMPPHNPLDVTSRFRLIRPAAKQLDNPSSAAASIKQAPHSARVRVRGLRFGICQSFHANSHL